MLELLTVGVNVLIVRMYMLVELCSKIGEDQSAEDAEDGPPELLVSFLSQ